MDSAGVRYIVDDVEAAVAFYTAQLGFDVVMRPAPTFAVLSRGALRLLLSQPVGPGGGAQVMPDGRRPEPGGWNRILLEVDDVVAEAARLHEAGVPMRSDVITGVGAKQVLVDDPAGNPVELSQPLPRG